MKFISKLSKVLLCSEFFGTVQKSLGCGAGFCGCMLFSMYLPNSVSYFLDRKKFFERKQVILWTKSASQGVQVQSAKQRLPEVSLQVWRNFCVSEKMPEWERISCLCLFKSSSIFNCSTFFFFFLWRLLQVALKYELVSTERQSWPR